MQTFSLFLYTFVRTQCFYFFINLIPNNMKKIFCFAIAALAVAMFTACSSKPKLEGTEVVKKYFTYLQPTGWEVEGNGADENKVIMHFEDSVKYTVTIEANDHCSYESEIKFYSEDADFCKPLPAEQDIQANGLTFKGFQKESDKYTFFITELTNAEKGKLTVSMSTNKNDVDPLQLDIFKEFIANVKLNAKEGEAKAE